MGTCSTKDDLNIGEFIDFASPLIAPTLLTLNANKANYNKTSKVLIASLTAAYLEHERNISTDEKKE